MRKFAIIGSRNIVAAKKIYKILDSILYDENFHEKKQIISGGAKGADLIAKKYAIERGIEYLEIIPMWETYGRAAAQVRNRKIVDLSDCVVAFWDGSSAGTKSAIDYANKNNKKVFLYML